MTNVDFAIAHGISRRQASKVLQGRKTLEQAQKYCAENNISPPHRGIRVDSSLRPTRGKTARKWAKK